MSLCLLCPGQGSQAPGMFERLAADPLTAALLTVHLEHVAPETVAVAGDPSRCFLNRHAQPLIVLYGVTVATALATAGIQPALVAGYSVGELTAHAVAGALTPASALRLAVVRAATMDANSPPGHTLLAVRGVRVEVLVEHAEAAGATIAIRNGFDHAILAGPFEVLEQLAIDLERRFAAHVTPLPISVPAHTHWLSGGVADLTTAFAAADWHPHRVPVLSGIDAHSVSTATDASGSLGRQIAEPLDWERTLDVAREMGATTFFEVGPGNGLTRMVRERFPDLQARTLDDFATMQGAIAWLQRQAG